MLDELPLQVAAAVLQAFPAALATGIPVALGNRGGFSGARLWRLDHPIAPLCLRAWPVGYPPKRLQFIHHCMRRATAAMLPFVPRLSPSLMGTTWFEYAGRLWELQEWLPGEADYHRRPSPAKLRAACGALARLHLCWQTNQRPITGPCPAVTRRLEAVHQWRELVQAGWRPPDAAAERAWRLVSNHIDAVSGLLQRWTTMAMPLQPCLCDVWHDHVLFENERVTGLIDYGAMKIDHPTVDLARLLGSLVEDDAAAWTTGLTAYREVRPFTTENEELAHALDRSGTILGAAMWLRWLYHDGKNFEDRAAAERRLEALCMRMERWQ